MTAPDPRATLRDVRKRAFLASYAAAVGFVPAPPHVKYVSGPAPGTVPTEMSGTAQAIGSAGTVYYQAPMDKFTRGHETGHVFDAEVLTDGDRRYFQRLMHAPTGAWRPGLPGVRSPDEWFADYYGAAAARIDLSKQGVSSYAQLGPVRLKRFEAALARIGRREHLNPYS